MFMFKSKEQGDVSSQGNIGLNVGDQPAATSVIFINLADQGGLANQCVSSLKKKYPSVASQIFSVEMLHSALSYKETGVLSVSSELDEIKSKLGVDSFKIMLGVH